MTQSLLSLSVTELAERVRGGAVPAVEIADQSLRAIRERSDLNAFCHVAEESALAAARRLDEQRRGGRPLGKLAGVPIALKDALCTHDQPTSCGSRMLLRSGDDGREHGWRSPYDATVVERLRAEGALLVGKANMDEFAMGSSSETCVYGPTRNPWDPERIPGGSSGGSAVAVAARLTSAALGSDTGGSIRQPAAHCGVVGVKPTYGRVSRYGLVAFASSLDQVGPMARDVRGAARVLEVIAGHDPKDSTSADVPVGDYEAACERGVSGLRFGVPAEYFGDGLDPSIRAAIEGVIAKIEAAGCTVTPVSLPHTDYGVATYYILATAEASSNLARFDGVRFGKRVEAPGADLQAMYGASRNAGFGREVKRRILLGTYVLSAGYYDAYYAKAQRVRTLIRQDFDRVFQDVDVLITPTSPTVAFRIGERLDDPLAMYMADVYTLPASLAGIPGISVPCGLTTVQDGRDSSPELPIGVQLLCPMFEEERLFAAAAGVEELVRAT
ncbi:MAG: Asp-tRNA(Asn)/Glu-tRNA(Gln) amidotransferase subunit GatA [Myxococcales bacterium]|nr:Asp-tRNA(Asn)/Glu-tRNA(Gln) amidotransferase subunit GatA [Myxococcales bacterium]